MELENLQNVIAKVDHLPDEAQKVIELGFKAGLVLVQNHAKTNHPSWPTQFYNPDGSWRYHNITTNLTNSINLKMWVEAEKIIGDVGVMRGLAVAAAMEYAEKIERDHPFIGPAVEAKKADWLKLCEDAMRSFFR